MNKVIDLRKKITELVKEYPELIDIMRDLGFEEIVKPGMLNTMGKFMTIPTGAALRRIDMEIIRETFKDKGFELIE